MSQIEYIVLEQVQNLHHLTRQPVRTRVLADFATYSERWVRYALVALESRGLIARRGERGGWLPVAS